MLTIKFTPYELSVLRAQYDESVARFTDDDPDLPYDNFVFTIIESKLSDDLKIRTLARVRIMEFENNTNPGGCFQDSLLSILGFSDEEQLARS